MAHHKDAKKRVRQIEKRTERNKSIRTFYRGAIKKVKAAVNAGDQELAKDSLKQAISSIDRAVSKNILAKSTAARYKSRLTKAVANLGSQASSS